MPKVTVSQFAKLMVDPKAEKIIKATQDEAGITPKQISAATKIPVNQLYYTLKKMLNADMLKVVKEVQVKNLTEKYYSSAQLGKVSELNQEKKDHENGMMNLSVDWIKEHNQELVQWAMLRNHEFIETLQKETTKKNPTAFLVSSEWELSEAGEKKLKDDLFKVLDNAEKNDPDPDNKQKKAVSLQLEKWRRQ